VVLASRTWWKSQGHTRDEVVKTTIVSATAIATELCKKTDVRALSWSTSSDGSSLTKLTSMLAASVRKRNRQRFENRGLQQEITNTSVAVTESIITDGISLALEELDMSDFDTDDHNFINFPYSDHHGGTEVRTSLPNVNHASSETSTCTEDRQRENNMRRLMIHNKWKSLSDPCIPGLPT